MFKQLKGSGKVGVVPGKLTGKFIGGTGKYAGIQSGFEADQYRLRDASEGQGVIQSYTKRKIWYRLP